MQPRIVATRLFPTLLFLLAFASAAGQGEPYLRSAPEANAYPFIHGVASGDPLTDRVIIWTRLTGESDGIQNVRWRVATDTAFSNVVRSGVYRTDANRDYTVKIDVDSLSPDTWYYYSFEHQGRPSLIGRTRTLPDGPTDSLRIAVTSCTCYQCGYFNPYDRIAERNDLDLVIHLGDYLYEYPALGYGYAPAVDRIDEPSQELITLSDYRIRHSWYKLDKASRRIHQQYPFIVTYDDHEMANDAWRGGAQNHNEATEGPWTVRRQAALRAWLEWMPVRRQDSIPLYRKRQIGGLVELFQIDTRLYRHQPNPDDRDKPNRTMLGKKQYEWLVDGLASSTARWKVILNQTMLAPLLNGAGNPIYFDQWDGYRTERNRLFDTLYRLGVENLLVLSGDIHSAWVNELPHYVDGDTVNIGTECICTSVSAIDRGINTYTAPNLYAYNPHIRFAKVSGRGYSIVDIGLNKSQCDHWGLSTLTQNTTQWPEAAFTIPEGDPRAIPALQVKYPANRNPPFAPWNLPAACPMPEMAGTYDIEATSAVLRWSPVEQASGYRIRLERSIDTTRWSILTPDTTSVLTDLLPATDYRWRVRSFCPMRGFSASGTPQLFKTLGASARTGVEGTAEAIDRQQLHVLGVYPNPYQNHLGIKVHIEADADLDIALLSADGKTIATWQRTDLPAGVHFQALPIATVHPAGIYRLRIQARTKDGHALAAPVWRTVVHE